VRYADVPRADGRGGLGEAWSVDEADGLRVLRDGEAEGRLLGGCLSILEAGLGTLWALRVDEPCILFLEDIGVKPYQWDRMLQHLRFAGLMERVGGVVFGDMGACVDAGEMELLEAACLHGLGGFAGPVAIGLRSGHVESGNRALPLGG
jgi:muramoyltetrapeptide carboxypeptidase